MLKKSFILVLLTLATPFGLLLSQMPGFHGWREWFEFCGMALRGEA